MTRREQEILAWIRDNPLISQQELAQRAGITRSSVAVHISNLMRKGLIRGRGYLLGEGAYVAVVGAVNVDIGGTPDSALVPADSNPGRVTVTLGGVGRNIAENLSRLGKRVLMVTAMGEDAHAQQIQHSCRELGIDLSHSLTVPNARTSTYLCLNDADGEIVGAVSDMAIYDALTPAYLSTQLEALNRAALVVLDANLPPESLSFLAENLKPPLFADPVSVKKAGRLRPILARLTAMKPNRPEASLLTGVDIHCNDDLPRAAKAFFDLGLENVFISLGAEGVYFDDGRDRGILPCFPSPVINTTGCGDAFLAAAACAWQEGCSLREMALHGLAASAICARSDSAVSPLITPDAIAGIVQNA